MWSFFVVYFGSSISGTFYTGGKNIFFLLIIVGVSTFQANPKEDDPVSWSNDAGRCNMSFASFHTLIRKYLMCTVTVEDGGQLCVQ